MELTCPKCHGPMRTYERNGVHVDQCSECRGIFLDRGELDRLIDAENAWHGGKPADDDRDRDRDRERSHEQAARTEYRDPSHSSSSGAGLGAVVGEVLRSVQGSSSKHDPRYSSSHRRKKESFLGDLFG